MGMFDYVRCEVQIPGLDNAPEREFQTKELDCLLDTYIITSFGTLLKYSYPVEYEDKQKRPEFMRDYTDELIFKDFVDGKLQHFYAQFENGRLISIGKVE